jgi:predicted AAA+ superfamily ATPase
VAQELIATKQQEPYYWASEGIAEVDFLIEENHAIYPLEVKSGESQKKKSLIIYNQKYAPSKLLRTSPMNLKDDGAVYNYPLYLIGQISVIN